MRQLRVLLFASLAAVGVFAMTLHALAAANAPTAESPLVVVINIDDTIDAGMAHRVQRQVDEAKTAGAHAIFAMHPAAALDHDRLDAAPVKQVRKHQAGRSSANDSDLRSHRHRLTPVPLLHIKVCVLTDSASDRNGQLHRA